MMRYDACPTSSGPYVTMSIHYISSISTTGPNRNTRKLLWYYRRSYDVFEVARRKAINSGDTQGNIAMHFS